MNMKAWGKAILREMLKLLLVILVHIHMKLEDNDHVLILLQLIKLLLGLLIQLKNSILMQQNDKIENKMRDHVRLCFISISIRNKCCHIWPDLRGKTIGLHSKVFIIDNLCYYVGSQNLYLFDLCEFDVAVDECLKINLSAFLALLLYHTVVPCFLSLFYLKCTFSN